VAEQPKSQPYAIADLGATNAAVPIPGTPDNPLQPPVLGGVPLFYRGRAGNRARQGGLPAPVRTALAINALYTPDPELIAAVNVALTLRLPLLLTGKPGTGKTELARNLAVSLHGTEDRLFDVAVTSGSDKADLLYRYDELARLRDAYQRSEGVHDRDYLELRGLGAAIVAAGRPGDALAPIAPGRPLPRGLATLADLLGAAPEGNADARQAFFMPAESPPPVVLIDEIDKAPRELPNDLLTELDRMRFAIPELGVRVALSDPSRWPVVIITSNAERPLSDAFLRRCVCFDVAAPEGERLRAILEAKLAALKLLDGQAALPAELVDFVDALRQSRDIAENEKPGTARVLDFAVLLADRGRFGGQALRALDEAVLRAALSALLPSKAAQDAAVAIWQKWKSAPPSPR
jgi:MoxR-like ATPase